MNQSNHIVTVIVPFRNAVVFLPEFIFNLRLQTFDSWHCLLVDDFSTDSGFELAESIVSGDSRFTLLKLPQHNRNHAPGPATARNYAISLVQSPLSAFCDVDDLWHPEKLRLQVNYHLKHSLNISVTAYARFRNTSGSSGLVTATVLPPSNINSRMIHAYNPLPMLTVVIDTRLVARGFPCVRHEDYALWLLLSSFYNLRIGCIPSVLAYYRQHHSNLTSNRLLMPFWVYKAYRCSGSPPIISAMRLIYWFLLQLKSRISFSRNGNHLKKISLYELLERPPERLSQDELSSS